MTQRGKDERDFGAILAAFEEEQAAASELREPQVGDKVRGQITSLGEEMAFVDLGAKCEGAIPRAELFGSAGEPSVSVGDTVEAMVAATNDDAGYYLLTVRLGQGPTATAELAQAHTHRIPVEGVVQEVIKGGFEVTVGGVRAFCPISQIDLHYVEDPTRFVGQRLTFRINRFEEGRGRGPNVVLSRRALLEEEAQRKAAETRARLSVGAVVRGTVTSLVSFGAFVDLGGLEGLVHVSELAHGRIENPGEVLTVGQELEVQVLKIEAAQKGEKQERISLSRRSLLQDPWRELAARLRPGERCTGKVVRLESFGAFVELTPGVDGLLHHSEVPSDAPVEPGQSLEVTVLSVDLERRRISLALRSPDPPAEEMPSPSSESSGFGALGDFFDRSSRRK